MSNLDPEIACGKYICAVQDIEKYAGMGLYGLDNRRREIHDELCRLFGLSKEETCKVTDNLDKIDYSPVELACRLYRIRNRKPNTQVDAPRGARSAK